MQAKDFSLGQDFSHFVHDEEFNSILYSKRYDLKGMNLILCLFSDKVDLVNESLAGSLLTIGLSVIEKIPYFCFKIENILDYGKSEEIFPWNTIFCYHKGQEAMIEDLKTIRVQSKRIGYKPKLVLLTICTKRNKISSIRERSIPIDLTENLCLLLEEALTIYSVDNLIKGADNVNKEFDRATISHLSFYRTAIRL